MTAVESAAATSSTRTSASQRNANEYSSNSASRCATRAFLRDASAFAARSWARACASSRAQRHDLMTLVLHTALPAAAAYWPRSSVMRTYTSRRGAVMRALRAMARVTIETARPHGSCGSRADAHCRGDAQLVIRTRSTPPCTRRPSRHSTHPGRAPCVLLGDLSSALFDARWERRRHGAVLALLALARAWRTNLARRRRGSPAAGQASEAAAAAWAHEARCA